MLFDLKLLQAAFSNSWRENNRPPISDVSRSQELLTHFSGQEELVIEGEQGNGPQLPLLSFIVVETATGNFANKNKLGQGGFGHVYKVKFYVQHTTNYSSCVNCGKE